MKACCSANPDCVDFLKVLSAWPVGMSAFGFFRTAISKYPPVFPGDTYFLVFVACSIVSLNTLVAALWQRDLGRAKLNTTARN